MTDRDERIPWERVGEGYNAPPATPREEMWARIVGRIGEGGAGAPAGGEPVVGSASPAAADVLDLAEARGRRSAEPEASTRRRWMGWSVAAAALLVLGIGIGRMSGPAVPIANGPEAVPAGSGDGGRSALGLAAREHLGRTEALLTMVRADARDGQVDPTVARWAEDLLAQTRLLLDRPTGVDPELRDLLLDLELVLVQVVGVAESGSDDERSRTEVDLTLKTLDEGEVLPRIRATIPPTMSGA